jgi:hypothetical protein
MQEQSTDAVAFYKALEKLAKDTNKSIYEVLQEYPHMKEWQLRIIQNENTLTENKADKQLLNG